MRHLVLVLVLAGTLPACAGSDSGAQQQRPSSEASATTTPTVHRTEQPPAECSAHDLTGEPDAQPGLPAAVAETRRKIYRAAVRCDFDRLAELIPAEGFTYSFGGGDDPTGSWRRAELQEEQTPPMRYLAGLLQRPYATREVQGRTQYEWPSAFGYDTWSDVPEQDRQALVPLYDEQDMAGFERFGAYIGYRVILTQRGTWTAFVAGD